MPVIEAQQFRMRQVLPPTASLLATAVVRVYTARQRPAGDGRAAWTYAGLSGALGVVYYAACKALCFRLWEVDGPRVLFEFEAYVAVHALGARSSWVLLRGVRMSLTALRARPGMRAWAIDGSPHGSTLSLPRTTSRWGSHSPVERTRIVCLPRYAAAASHHLPGTVLTIAPCARMLQASSFIPTPPPPPQFTMDVRAQTVTGWFRHVLGFDGGKAKAGKAHKKRHKKKSRMSVGEPTNAKLGTHVARGPHGSFHLSSLSPEWKEMLVAAGVTEADLADDSTARILKDIIAGSSDASAEALAPLLAAGLESSGPDTDGEVGPEDGDGGGDWEPAPNPEAPAFIKTYNPVFTRSDGATAQAVVAPPDASCAVQAAAGFSAPSATDVLAVDAGQDGAAGVRGTGAPPHSDGSSSPAVSSVAGPSQDPCARGTSQSPRATAAAAAAVPGNATPPQSPRPDDDNAGADAEASANVDAAGSDDKPITVHVSAAVGASPPPAPAVAGPVSPTFVRSSLPPLTAIAESDADEEPDDTAAGTAAGGGSGGGSAVPAHGTSEAGQAGGADVPHAAVSPRGSVPAASPRSPVQSSGSGSGDGGGNSSGGNSPPPRQPRAKRSFTRRASLFLQAKMGLSKPKAAEPAPLASPTKAKPCTAPDSDADVARGGAGAGAGASGAKPRGPVPLMKSPGFLSQLAAGKQALKKGRKRGVRRGCETQPRWLYPDRPPCWRSCVHVCCVCAVEAKAAPCEPSHVSPTAQVHRCAGKVRYVPVLCASTLTMRVGSCVSQLQRTMAARRRAMATRSDSESSDDSSDSD